MLLECRVWLKSIMQPPKYLRLLRYNICDKFNEYWVTFCPTQRDKTIYKTFQCALCNTRLWRTKKKNVLPSFNLWSNFNRKFFKSKSSHKRTLNFLFSVLFFVFLKCEIINCTNLVVRMEHCQILSKKKYS